MKSMTGYGHGQKHVGTVALTVEVQSVNRKQLDIQASLPAPLTPLEPEVAARVAARVSRGRIRVLVGVGPTESGPGRTVLDTEFAAACHRELLALQQSLGILNEPDLNTLLKIPGVLVSPHDRLDIDAAGGALPEVLDQALDGMDAMRAAEGKALAAELARIADSLERLLDEVRGRAPDVIRHYHDALRKRLDQFHTALPIDGETLAREVAVYADRCDITEELARLDSHLGQLRELMGGSDPVGRRLDFLAQEMMREVNTISSKANDAAISMRIVAAKSELDRLREQVQNVE